MWKCLGVFGVLYIFSCFYWFFFMVFRIYVFIILFLVLDLWMLLIGNRDVVIKVSGIFIGVWCFLFYFFWGLRIFLGCFFRDKLFIGFMFNGKEVNGDGEILGIKKSGDDVYVVWILFCFGDLFCFFWNFVFRDLDVGC